MRRRLASITALTAGIALLSSCALGDDSSTKVSAGSLADKGDLSGVELTVGGK